MLTARSASPLTRPDGGVWESVVSVADRLAGQASWEWHLNENGGQYADVSKKLTRSNECL
jgi:hypothetical protein